MRLVQEKDPELHFSVSHGFWFPKGPILKHPTVLVEYFVWVHKIPSNPNTNPRVYGIFEFSNFIVIRYTKVPGYGTR